ncbi:MAG: Ig-like domain-containing protein, partial [Desulfobacterales bacterium]|nr:Ig-like domain-containing protein [Desulfobacterales bacterium]
MLKSKLFNKLFKLLLLIFFIDGCDNGSVGHWNSPELVSIKISPQHQSIEKGTAQQFMATGIYSNNTTVDITSSVIWSSSDENVATINNGLATSKAIGGSITITATDQSTGKSGTANLIVTLSVTETVLLSINVTPVNPNIYLGTKQSFIATGTYSDATTKDLTLSMIWSSSNETIATISNTTGLKGLATSLAVGITTITATDPVTGKSGTSTLTIITQPVITTVLTSIDVTPSNKSIYLGTNQAFIATGIYSDANMKTLTSSVTWTSSNTAVASISNAEGYKGLATSLAVGVTTIVATDSYTGKTGTATLTVTAATLSSIEVTPANPIISLGINQQFKAIGIYSDATTKDLTSSVTWTSSNTAIATISNATDLNGLASSKDIGGSIIITA